MADTTVERDKGGNLTWLWALLAVLAVIGLMVWLASQDVEEGPVAVEEESAVVAEGATTGAEAAELTAIAAAPATFEGRPVQVNGVNVAASLGTRTFWADVPGANPFLVVLAPAVANPEAAAIGSTVGLQGTVVPVTPELISEWVQQGALNEGARAEAEFATHAIQAERLTAGQ